MDWLLTRDPNNGNKTRIDLYREKQSNYTRAFERKTQAFHDHLEKIPKDLPQEERREQFDEWVAANYKAYNNHIQAAYMDWVTMGKKEEVEYYFSIVDNDSAMARVEASKVIFPRSVLSRELKPRVSPRNACVCRSSPIPTVLPNTSR